MRKTLSLPAKVLSLVLFTLLFINCSDDDKGNTNNGNNDKIVGSWVYNGYTDADGIYHAEDTDPCHSFTVTFNGDRTGNEVDKNCQEGDETENFTWVANRTNVYTLTYEEDVDVITVNFVNDGKLTVTYEGSTYTETFTKK